MAWRLLEQVRAVTICSPVLAGRSSKEWRDGRQKGAVTRMPLLRDVNDAGHSLPCGAPSPADFMEVQNVAGDNDPVVSQSGVGDHFGLVRVHRLAVDAEIWSCWTSSSENIWSSSSGSGERCADREPPSFTRLELSAVESASVPTPLDSGVDIVRKVGPKGHCSSDHVQGDDRGSGHEPQNVVNRKLRFGVPACSESSDDGVDVGTPDQTDPVSLGPSATAINGCPLASDGRAPRADRGNQWPLRPSRRPPPAW